MLLKTNLLFWVTFFVFLTAGADQKGMSFLSGADAPQAQVEWFLDSQGNSWTFSLKGVASQLVGKNPNLNLNNYKARIVDRQTGKEILPWQGESGRYSNDASFVFILTTGDVDLIPQLESPSDSLNIEISFDVIKGEKVQKNLLYKISLKDFCTTFVDQVTQPFTTQNGCFHSSEVK